MNHPLTDGQDCTEDLDNVPDSDPVPASSSDYDDLTPYTAGLDVVLGQKVPKCGERSFSPR